MLEQTNLISCSHSEMTVQLIDFFKHYKKQQDFKSEDFKSMASEVLLFLKQRCSNQDLVDSYCLFILKKIEVAFKSSLNVKTQVQDEEFSGELLDIPVEEFQEAQIDEEFVKAMGWVD